MKSLEAFARGEAARAAGARSRVFDWNRAAQRIRETQPQEAGAGLSGDWEWTGGTIYKDGAPVPREETYTFLASNWAIPELELDGIPEPCWVWWDDDLGWDSGTYWPDSALAILATKGEN